jgi:hypothetical protein
MRACHQEAAIPFGPGGIRLESGHDILIFCRILENIPTKMSHFKQQKRAV